MKYISLFIFLLFICATTTCAQTLLRLKNWKPKASVTTTTSRPESLADSAAAAADSSANNKKVTPLINADFTIPNLGNGGINVLPTPTFSFNQLHLLNKWAFSASVWGNALTTDSSMQQVVAKLLIPQASIFGLAIESDYTITNEKDTNFTLAAVAKINLLGKSVSFFDTASKTNTHFNPFCIQPKVGLIAAFFNNSFYISAYYNMLTPLTANNDFKTFFKTGRTTFYYPEFDCGGFFGLGDQSNQLIKFDFSIIVNNKDVQPLYGSGDKVIPYLKIGFATKF